MATSKGAVLYLISIHAPPRGATAENLHAERLFDISIHAPPRGATVSGTKTPQQLFVFQFTPLREGRRVAEHLYKC